VKEKAPLLAIKDIIGHISKENDTSDMEKWHKTNENDPNKDDKIKNVIHGVIVPILKYTMWIKRIIPHQPKLIDSWAIGNLEIFLNDLDKNLVKFCTIVFSNHKDVFYRTKKMGEFEGKSKELSKYKEEEEKRKKNIEKLRK
jgi:hypothetical protein